jgi:pantothenate kinase-related protein Tda10
VDENSRSDFVQVCQWMLMLQHAKSVPVTKSAVAEQLHHDITDKVGSVDNIHFWSSDQLSVLKEEPKRLLIRGFFGTGKSLLLMEKAERLAKQLQESNSPERVHFVAMHGDSTTRKFNTVKSIKKY